MKRSTLVDLALKIVGIFQITPLLSGIFWFISMIPGVGQYFDASTNLPNEGFDLLGLVLMLTSFLISPVIYLLICYQLIFRSHYWTRKILKHEEYDEDIRIKLEPTVVLQLALITSSMLMFFWNMPDVIGIAQQWFVSKASNSGDFIPTSFDSSILLEPTIKIIIALIAFTWSYPISLWLAKRIPGPEQTSATEDPIKE